MVTAAARKPTVPLTLWGQAMVFVLFGSGAFVAALVVVSSLVVTSARERLLDERMALAQSVAQLLEHQIQTDIERLVKTCELLLLDPSAQSNPLSSTLLLAAVRLGSLRDGAFVLDHEGKPLVAALGSADDVLEIQGLEALVDRAAKTGQAVLSPLHTLRGGPVIAVVAPVRGRRRALMGFTVGLLQPVESDLLRALRQASLAVEADFAVLDADGVHVAATEASHLMEHTTRDGALAQAIRSRQAFRGVHDYHAAESPPGPSEVLAFAPMKGLDLSVIVIQPEDKALAPAFELRRRLLGFFAPLVVLFVAFSLLSVHSVVRPVRALTLAVRRARSDRPLKITGFSRDEVGELATSMQSWHRGMLESLAAAEDHRAALDRETRAMRRYLEALQAVSEASTAGVAVRPMLQSALLSALGFLNALRGVMVLDRAGRRSVAAEQLTDEEAEALIEAAARRVPPGCGDLVDLSDARLAASAGSARALYHECAPDMRLGLVRRPAPGACGRGAGSDAGR